jgi:hypothetical protein
VQYNAAALAQFNKEVHVKIAGIDQHKTVIITGEVLNAEAYDTWSKTKSN